MTAYKRSDPKKLKADREAEGRDLVEREHLGEPKMGSAWGFNRPATPRGKGLVEQIKDFFKRSELRRNPPPRQRGARVIGFRDPRTEA